MRRFGSYLLLAVVAVAVLVTRSPAVDQLEEFQNAKRKLISQLHRKDPAQRLEAIEGLSEYPLAETTKLLLNTLPDESSEVREAALAALIKMTSSQEVCDTLVQLAGRAVTRRDDGEAAAPLLAILLSAKLPSAQRDTAELFDKMATTKNGLGVTLGLADELAEDHQPMDVVPLLGLAKTKLFADNFGLRRAVVHALTKITTRDAVGALIEIMPQIEGEAQADAVEHLAEVTDQIFGMETAAWQRWWAMVKDTFEYPSRHVQVAYRSSKSTSGDYYGLPIFAERMVFVLDTSGSMTGPRIVAAKRELIKSIAGLPDHAHFSIVVFNSGVSLWQRELVPATDHWKQLATRYVNSQGTQLNTASYDALEAAFGFDTEAIYFLSDGAPHGGKIPAPVDIVAAITAANKTRRISLYTIGIGAGFPGSPLDVFLKTLAEQNLGLYRRVDG